MKIKALSSYILSSLGRCKSEYTFTRSSLAKIENCKLKINTGFTIIELIVSVAIISIISAVVFWNGRGFNDRIEVAAAAQEASFAVREAQNYGVSVRESSSNTGLFNYAYGVAFSLLNPTYVTVFVDKNNNQIYDDGPTCDGSGECVEKVFLRNGVTIKDLCKVDSSNNVTCPGGWDSFQIIFKRPNLDSIINIVNGGSIVFGSPLYAARITLSSRQGVLKYLSINSAGQVSVQ